MKAKAVKRRHRPLPAKLARHVAEQFRFGAGIVALVIEHDVAPSQIENAIRKWGSSR